MTEVTKEDREAAERWGTGPVYSMNLCAESFARHREASTEALRARVSGVLDTFRFDSDEDVFRLIEAVHAALGNRDD